MAAKVKASANDVRVFGRANGATGAWVSETTRGRLPAEWIARFEKETGKRYVAGFKPETKVTLRPTKVDKNGKRRVRPVQKSLAEVRALAGDAAGARGVLSEKARNAAESALSDPLTEAEVDALAAETEVQVTLDETTE
mgnify:CR=1 FL=1